MAYFENVWAMFATVGQLTTKPVALTHDQVVALCLSLPLV